MPSSKESAFILVVDDDIELAEMLRAYFTAQGYRAAAAYSGEAALAACDSVLPDLIILDITMPDIDGFEVARRLRSKRLTRNLPIIFLTGNEGREDRLQGLGFGADDYMTKPFDVQELRLRTRNSLTRASQTQLRNPVTNLPEGQWLDERLREMLTEPVWAVLVIGIEHLAYFREEYGFIAADDVLRAISLMIENTVSRYGQPGDFFGHLALDAFVVVTSPEVGVQLRNRLAGPLQQSLDYFYPMRDRETDTGRLKSIYTNRLDIRLGILGSTEGSFSTINSLKDRLALLVSN
ncbi:MAG: response regulator [Anaerolineales bacterium]|nr:response regulator [Anaerolineales bacterium]